MLLQNIKTKLPHLFSILNTHTMLTQIYNRAGNEYSNYCPRIFICCEDESVPLLVVIDWLINPIYVWVYIYIYTWKSYVQLNNNTMAFLLVLKFKKNSNRCILVQGIADEIN